MNNYKEFNQFEYLKDLDNFEKYEIHLNNILVNTLIILMMK
jgi:hypothetical protein